jgi:hypothetical protein
MNGNTPLSVRSLLSTLQGDARSIKKKRSCRDLLRSKAIPSPQVLEVAATSSSSSPKNTTTTNKNSNARASLTAETLTQAQDVLLEEYTYAMPCKEEESALLYMNRLVVVFRFVQLLLLRESESAHHHHHHQVLPLDQCHKLVSILLQRTCQELCTLVESFPGTRTRTRSGDANDVENEKENEDDKEFDLWTIDASTTSDPRPVIGFAISWLLRINYHYANEEVVLMMPVWSGICSVLTAASSTCKQLPPELVDDSLKALSSHLVGGQRQILLDANHNNKRDSTAPPPSSSIMSSLRVNLTSFLVLRATSLLKLVTQDDSPVVHSVWKVLATLRGMASALQLREASSSIHFKIGTKVQQQVTLLALAHTPSWNALLKTDFGHHDHDDNDDNEHLVHTCQVLGRVLLLQWILKDGASQSKNFPNLTEPILRTCECLLSVAIPECYAPIELALFLKNNTNDDSTQRRRTLVGTLLHTSLQAMCNVLTRIIVFEQDDTCSKQRRQTHRLFCRWMDQKHPLARELSVSLISMVLIETQSTALLSLVVKLLFDHRTTSILRNNISTLLIRILRNQNLLLSTATQQMMEMECLALLESTNNTRTKKKRKRSSKAATKIITWAYYDHDAIQAICNTIIQQQCQTTPSHTLTTILKSFCKRTKDCLDPSSDSCHIRLESSKRVALQIAYIEALLCDYSYGGTVPQDGLAQRFSTDMGVNISDLLLALIHSVEKSSFGTLKEGDDHASAECKAILASSVLRLCAKACDAFDADSGALPIGQVCRFLAICANNETTLTNATSSSSVVSKYQRMIVFEAVLLLQSVGKALPSSCPDRILKVGCYFSSFSFATLFFFPTQSSNMYVYLNFFVCLHIDRMSNKSFIDCSPLGTGR